MPKIYYRLHSFPNYELDLIREIGYTKYNELSEWLPKVQKLDSMAEKTFIFANNHWRGQAGSAIRQLRMMLD